MTEQEQRKIETFAIGCPLSQVEDPDMLAFMGSLMTDHDHLREKLMTEPDRAKRVEKFEAMRSHLKFKPVSLASYEMAEAARAVGSQPFYEEEKTVEKQRIWMPPSFVHEVRG